MADGTGWIAAYVGLPYRPGGRSRSGLDCWGLVVLVARERFGLVLPHFDETVWRSRADDAAVAAVAADEAARWRAVAPESAAPGDVLLLRVGRHAAHAGICATPGRMLHVERGIDSAYESFLDLRHRPRLVGAYRWQGARHA